MKDYIRERTILEAIYTIKHRTTVRETAKIFKVSKSTVSDDLRRKLKKINPQMANVVRVILDHNYDERAIRGGHATKMKYKAMQNKDRVVG